MARRPGLSARTRFTLSYAGFLMIAGLLILAAMWTFLLRDPSPGLPPLEPADFLRALDPTNRGPQVFLPATILVLVFMLIFGLVGGWFLAGRMLAPLSHITEATRAAARGELSHRIALPGSSDEFRELADSFDDMLGRLEEHVAEQQRFAANASHELRTPLAITQTLLEVAGKDPARAGSELDERLRAVNTRAIELTEALLMLSRADQRSFLPEDVDLSLLVEEAVETLLPLSQQHGVTIGVSGDDAPTAGSPALLLQMVTNLVHNAVVHNLPAGGTVSVQTESGPEEVVLVVENTGRLLSRQLVATLTEPFQRGAERVRTAHAGVGLGLAIVERIVGAHAGRLSLRPRIGGGLTVAVSLPRAGSAPADAPLPGAGESRLRRRAVRRLR